MKDLTLDRVLKRGSKGKKVKLIQEWLILRGLDIKIDSDFGPATKEAVLRYQAKHGLKQDGKVGKNTFTSLTLPMRRVLEDIPAGRKTLGALVVAYARQHLREHPREVGGQNCGPWVRLYMDGQEGQEWAWCAGFACFLLKQAATTIGVPLPITPSVSCDSLAASGKGKGLFLPESKVRAGATVPRGSLFLVRRTPTDWIHTGIVTNAKPEVIETIEGNTNDDGHRDGYEVCNRLRNYKKKDFIVL